MLTLILTSLLSFHANAVGLSLESLLRHASNGDVQSNTVSVNFLVKKISDEPGQPFYLRQIYGLEGEKLRYSQVIFDGAEMSNTQLQSAFTTANLADYLGKNPEKDLLNATISNIFFNDAKVMMNFLKKAGIPVKGNSESYNTDKTKIMESYKTYLKSPTTKENPLKTTTPEERKKVNELNQTSLIAVPADTVKMIRKNRANYIQYSYPNFMALFSNHEHRLSEVEMNSKYHTHIQLEEYVALNGLNYFPKFITIRVDNDTYRLQTLSYKYGNESYAEFEKRGTGLQSLAKKNTKEVLVQKSIFLQ